MTALESKALGTALEKLNLTDLPPPYIAAWHRRIEYLDQQITKLTIERDLMRERLRQIEQ